MQGMNPSREGSDGHPRGDQGLGRQVPPEGHMRCPCVAPAEKGVWAIGRECEQGVEVLSDPWLGLIRRRVFHAVHGTASSQIP